MLNYEKSLIEAGFPIARGTLFGLNEAAQLKVTDDVLTKMMKFITDKYNSLDMSEIEKSAGDIKRFKYTGIIQENIDILENVYQNSTDLGAEKYLEVCRSAENVLAFLHKRSNDFSVLYKSGNGFIQLLYTSLVAACIYSIGVLISNTIRFVTVEQDTDCQVLFDEIPGTIKHVHIKNIVAAAKDIGTMDRILDEMMNQSKKRVNESVVVTAGVVALLVLGGIILLVPRIIILIREIIYSIYHTRVKISDMLALQTELVRTNIESLEAGRGNKKIIARQKRIADKLEKWKDRLAIKMDTTEVAVKMQKTRENKELALDRDSPLVQEINNEFGSGVMI